MIRLVALSLLLAVAAGAESVERLPYELAAPPDNKSALAQALAGEPTMVRDVYIDTRLPFVRYLLDHPVIAHKLTQLFSSEPFTLEKPEDEDEWYMHISGRDYRWKTVETKDGARILSYSLSAKLLPVGKLSATGDGALLVSAKEGDDAEETNVGYDIYFTPGNTKIDKLTKGFSGFQQGMVAQDFERVADVFKQLCETVGDDTESIADEMADADDLFTKADVAEYRKRLLDY